MGTTSGTGPAHGHSFPGLRKPCIQALSRSDQAPCGLYSHRLAQTPQRACARSRAHFTRLIVHSAQKAAPPRQVRAELCPPVSLWGSVSPLAVSLPLLCCPQGKERKRSGENQATTPLCHVAPWVAEPAGPPGAPGARDQDIPSTHHTHHCVLVVLTHRQMGVGSEMGAKSSTAPNRPGTCQWHGAVRLPGGGGAPNPNQEEEASKGQTTHPQGCPRLPAAEAGRPH